MVRSPFSSELVPIAVEVEQEGGLDRDRTADGVQNTGVAHQMGLALGKEVGETAAASASGPP